MGLRFFPHRAPLHSSLNTPRDHCHLRSSCLSACTFLLWFCSCLECLPSLARLQSERQPSGHCAVTYSLLRRRVAQLVNERVSPDCTATSFIHPLRGQINRTPLAKAIACCKRRTLRLAYITSGFWVLAAQSLRQVHSGTNRRPWHPIHYSNNEFWLHPSCQPNNISLSCERASFFSPYFCHYLLATHSTWATTHGASRCRCRRSAFTSQEPRDHPRAHRLQQATPTRRRRSNAHTPTRRQPSCRRPAQSPCASMSRDQNPLDGWQTPRHHRPAASPGRQRSTPRASTMRLLSA